MFLSCKDYVYIVVLQIECQINWIYRMFEKEHIEQYSGVCLGLQPETHSDKFLKTWMCSKSEPDAAALFKAPHPASYCYSVVSSLCACYYTVVIVRSVGSSDFQNSSLKLGN